MEGVCKLMSWKVTQGLCCIVVPPSTQFTHAHGGHHSIIIGMEKVIYAEAHWRNLDLVRMEKWLPIESNNIKIGFSVETAHIHCPIIFHF